MVFAQTTQDVADAVKLAAAHRVPVIPFGVGSSLEGHLLAVQGGISLDVSRMNQVVAINKGTRDGIQSGEVLAILKNGATIVDKTSDAKETLKLPNERIGLLMVFRPFEKVSYALILEVSDTPKAGDLLVNP